MFTFLMVAFHPVNSRTSAKMAAGSSTCEKDPPRSRNSSAFAGAG
jgi:hypothetical protein